MKFTYLLVLWIISSEGVAIVSHEMPDENTCHMIGKELSLSIGHSSTYYRKRYICRPLNIKEK